MVLSSLRKNIVICGTKEFNFLFAVFGVWAFLSGVIAINHSYWIQNIEYMARALIVFFLVYNSFNSKTEIILVCKVIVLSIFLSTFIAFIVFAFKFSVSLSNLLPLFTERFAGTIFDPNYFAMTVAASTPLAVVLMLRERFLVLRLFWICTILFLIFTMMISQSRTGLFSIAVIFAYSMFYLIRKKRKEVYYMLAPIVVTLTLLPPVFWYRINLFMNAIMAGGKGDPSMYHRCILFSSAADVFFKNFLFGVGLGNFEAIASRYTQYPMVCHNTYLEVAANLGICGLIPFLAILYKGYSQLKKPMQLTAISEYAWAIRAGLLGLYVAILFLSVPFKLDLWIFLSLSSVIYNIATNHE
jgi:O-antigen ligase